MKAISFEESRTLQLEMLKEIHGFCTDNDINYFMAFGTLLGAVRHKGFIPWDDDLDIIMPYDDYLKFQECYKSQRYTVCSCLNDNEMGFEFGRFYDNRTYGIFGSKKIRGVCVDIYLLHGTPDNRKTSQFDHYLKSFRENRIKLARLRNLLLKAHPLFGESTGFFLLNWYCKRYTKKMSKYSRTSKRIAISGIRYSQNRAPFNERILLKFEDGAFYAPKGFDECLTVWYGNYMKLPPEEQRVLYHGFDNYWK